MILQNTFYVMAIIFMGLQAVILAVLIVILLFIQHMIKDLHKSLREMIDKGKAIAEHPGGFAAEAGSAMAGRVIDKVAEMISKPGEKKSTHKD